MNSVTNSSLRFVAFATAVTAIGGFLFRYDTAVINGANSYLKANMNLSPSQEGLAGASAILPKPFEIDDLINTIACYTSSTQESESWLPEASRER